MFQGLVAMLPAILTLYILSWLVRSAETVVGAPFKVLLPDGWYVPKIECKANPCSPILGPIQPVLMLNICKVP